MPSYIWHGGRWIEADRFVRAPSVGPMIMRDLPAHKSPVDGTVIEGRVQRREYLKVNNLREVDPSEWRPTQEIGEAKRKRHALKKEQAA
jgi:hypothetical protein